MSVAEFTTTAEAIANTLRQHQVTRGMRVASGVTCRCGYWTGNEKAGKTRPVGCSGLTWHQAVEIDRALAIHDAEARQAVLVEVAEWLEGMRDDVSTHDVCWDYTSIERLAQSIRDLVPQTPQNEPETGQRGARSVPAGDWPSDGASAQQAAEEARDGEQTSEVYPSEAQDITTALRQASKRAVSYRTGGHALLARAADFIEGQPGPRTWYRVTRDVPASDWSFWSSAPLMESHDAFIKRVAPLAPTPAEMLENKARARKEAHAIDVDHAVALERLAIVKMLEGYAESTDFYGQKHHAPHIRNELGAVARNLRGAASEIRDGAHHRRAGA